MKEKKIELFKNSGSYIHFLRLKIALYSSELIFIHIYEVNTAASNVVNRVIECKIFQRQIKPVFKPK